MTGNGETLDEGQLFETLCEQDAGAQRERLSQIESNAPALAARLRRLLALDSEYREHTARNALIGQPPEPATDLGDIGAFRLVRQLGRGGMGVVYLAERRSGFEQQVAIKVMPRFATDIAGRERFAQERSILAQLRHPNICSIHDGGELDDGTPWLAMEPIDGEPLFAWCQRHRCDARERVSMFLQLCDAVQYAHRNLVIHRDLKDSNVLVDGHGQVKLLDFGIAKSIAPTSGDRHTALQDRFFSPMTAAPEQLLGERATVGVDIYALGTLLHQLLCGVLPFERPHRDPVELQRVILELVPPKMSASLQREIDDGRDPFDGAISPATLQGELDAIVAHCLRKSSAERYADVRDLANDLRAWMSGYPLSISGNDRLYRLRKFWGRHRAPIAIGTFALSVILVSLGTALWQTVALREQRDAAHAARKRSEADRDRAQAVARFMRDTFEVADPTQASEADMPARDLIVRGKSRLGMLDAQPLAQADLALLLAEMDASMGMHDESERTRRAYAAKIETLSVADPRIQWRAKLLALSNRTVLDDDGPQLDADLMTLKSLAKTPAEHIQVARQEGRLLSRRSKFDLAANALERAWKLHAKTLEDGAEFRMRIDLGNAYISAGRDTDARRIHDSIDNAALNRYPPALQIHALRFIARELDHRGGDRAALAQAVDTWRRTAERLYGNDSLDAANAYVWSAGITVDPLHRDALMQKAYAIQRMKLPPASMSRAQAEFNMASFYIEFHHAAAMAEPHFAAAVLNGRDATSRSHTDVRGFELAWARNLNALNRYRACLDALSDPPEHRGKRKDAVRSADLHLELARSALALNDPARASREISAAKRAWQRLGEALPDDRNDVIRSLERRLDVH